MVIELLTVTGCPHRTSAMARVRAALEEVEAVDAVVSEREITSAVDAAAAGMRGSPTILVDGDDLFLAESVEPSLSCRLYRSPAGVDGAPSVAALIDALTARPPARCRHER